MLGSDNMLLLKACAYAEWYCLWHIVPKRRENAANQVSQMLVLPLCGPRADGSQQSP